MAAVLGDFLAAANEHLEAAVVVGDGQLLSFPRSCVTCTAWSLSCGIISMTWLRVMRSRRQTGTACTSGSARSSMPAWPCAPP